MIQGENVFWIKTKVSRGKTISCVFKTDKSEDTVLFYKNGQTVRMGNYPLVLCRGNMI